MIVDPDLHPEDPEVIVHGWKKGKDTPFILGSSRKFTREGTIPAEYVRKKSKGLKTEWMSPKERIRVADRGGIEVFGDVPASDLKALVVYAEQFKEMLDAAILDVASSLKFLVHVFNREKDFCDYAALCGAANALSYYDPAKGEVVLWFDWTTSNNALQGIFAHEFTHAYIHRVFGTVSPLWFVEGIAQYFQYFTWDQDTAIPGKVDMVELGKLYPQPPLGLDELFRIPREMMYKDPRFPKFYAQAWSVVHYLINIQPDIFKKFLWGVGSATEIDAEAWRYYLDDLFKLLPPVREQYS